MEYGDFERNLERLETMKRDDLIYEMPVGVAVARGGNELYLEVVNKEFLRAEGYEREELLASKRPYTDYIYSDDVGRFEDAIESCKNKKATEVMELRMRTKEGGVRWEMLQCKLYAYRGATPLYIITSWDIDERKNLEEELR
ncbi:MAG: PAS domain-containing protein, partial [Prevotella sp.]|nr:PAS domain-containing protein [Prevotella sp.]